MPSREKPCSWTKERAMASTRLPKLPMSTWEMFGAGVISFHVAQRIQEEAGDLIADGNPPEIDEVDRAPQAILADERGKEVAAELAPDLRYTVTLEQPNHCPEGN